MKQFFVLSAISIIVLYSCSSTKNITNLSTLNNQQEIRLKPGETYKLSITENPSTGYTWSTNIPDDCNVKVTSAIYKQDKAPKGYVGVGGVKTFTIKAQETGTCNIFFIHGRTIGEEPLSTKEIVFIVE